MIIRSCSTPQLTVTPLHMSDHYFVSFSLSYPPSRPSNNSPTVTFRRDLCTLSNSSHLLYTPSPVPLSLNRLLMLLPLPLSHPSPSVLTHWLAARISPLKQNLAEGGWEEVEEIQILSWPDDLTHLADRFYLCYCIIVFPTCLFG